MAVSRELQDYYEATLDTLRSPGWKLIVEDFDRVRAAVEDVRSCSNLDYAKGQLDILDMLATWKETVEKAYEQLLAEDEAGE
jgi:hypothetical protein